jgi:uncharacterized membrane protein YeaQ/YmgE (transglycosylase-associated protein family)
MKGVVWLLVGALVGWAASLITRTSGRPAVLVNVAVGIVGSMLGGFFLTRVIGNASIPDQNNITLPSLAMALAGAIALSTAVNYLRSRALR